MAASQPRSTQATASSAPSAAPTLVPKAPASPVAAEVLPKAEPASPRISPFSAAVSPTLTSSSCWTEAVEGGHLFHIHQYRLLKYHDVGNFVRSDTFDVGGHSWALLFYPVGSEAASGGQHHVSVYLQLMTPNVQVRALFDLRIMDQSTGGWHSLFDLDAGVDRPRRHAVFSTFPTNRPLHHPPRCWGVPSLKASNLDTPAYIKNGSFTIRCDMTVIKPPRVSKTKQLTRIEAPPPGLSKDFGRLLEEKNGKDVTVRVGGEAFRAHWAVLAARSPVLRKKLLDAVDETKPSSIVITMDEDMEPAVFRAMLHFMYTDELPPDNEGHDGGDYKTAEFVRRLFVAADRCGIDRLKQLCESLLYRNLSKRTLKATMEFARQHRCDKLRAACVRLHAACYPSNKRGHEGADADTGDSEDCKRLKKN